MIDIEQEAELHDYLSDRFPEALAARPHGRTYSMEILSGGVSNRTVLVTLPSGRKWVVKQALDRLRVPTEWYCSPERIHREALGIQILGNLLPGRRIPALVFEDRSNHILCMDAVREPFSNWKEELLAGRLKMRHVRSFARILASIHSGGLRLRDSLPSDLMDISFFWNLRLEPYYRYTGKQLGAARVLLESLVEGYENRRYTLVHADFSPKNILIRRGRLILLDHEALHIGDPAFDLGFSFAHLLSKAHHMQGQRVAFIHAAGSYWSCYLQSTPPRALSAWGGDFERRVVRNSLGCLLARVAGRSQLEYLSERAKERQTRVVLRLVRREPRSMKELISRFAMELEG